MATATAPVPASLPPAELGEAALNTSATDVLSSLVIVRVDSKLRKRALSSWPNDVVAELLEFATKELEQHPDGTPWPYASATRLAVVADQGILRRAVDSRSPAPSAAIATEKPVPANAQLDAFTAVSDVAAGVTEEVLYVPIAEVAPDPDQPRRDADDELAESIKSDGVLQPLIVRPYPHRPGMVDWPLTRDGKATVQPKYMIRYGERRYRGALKAGRPTIPVIVRDEDEGRVRRLIRQNLENTSKPLSALDEARNWKELQEATGWNINQLAKALSKSKSTVSDRLALADAPAAFRPLFDSGLLSPAAAPIVRKYADVPAPILEKAVKDLNNFVDFKDAAREKRAVPLEIVEESVGDVVGDHVALGLTTVPADLEKYYRGPVITVGGLKYTTDAKQLEALRKDREKALAAQAPKSATSGKPEKAAATAKREQSQWEKDEAKRRKQQREKVAQRRAQFHAIAPLVPTQLTDKRWGLYLVRWLAREMHQDTLRMACAALDLGPSDGLGNRDYAAQIVKRADGLSAEQLVQLALQLLLTADLVVGSWDTSGARRFAEAAGILKINLAGIKAVGDDDSDKKAAPKTSAKTASKAKASKPALKGKAKKAKAKGKK